MKQEFILSHVYTLEILELESEKIGHVQVSLNFGVRIPWFSS